MCTTFLFYILVYSPPLFSSSFFIFVFFFNDTATTEIYTLSLHDALPICGARHHHRAPRDARDGDHRVRTRLHDREHEGDRKSTRLNSSHVAISYAVFCLKKKNKRPKFHA